MKRRQLIAAGSALALSACAEPSRKAPTGSGAPRFEWKMVTSWPRDLPGLGTGAARLAEMLGEASGGRLRVTLYAGNELVAPFDVFDAVARGAVEMGHSGAYYWKGKSEAAPFFCAMPFGLNAQEMNGWLYHGGGLALWRELYAKFGLVPFPCGNTGVQMAGWFNREILSVDDLKGLKMRIPGLAGDVMARLGVVPVNLPGGDIFHSLQQGAIDAAEWMSPYNDLAFGLHRVAKYCYYPGWQEPGPTLECIVNQHAYAALPDDLKAILDACCRAINADLLAEYTVRNQDALKQLIDVHKVEFRRLPDPVLAALREQADAILAELATRDPFTKRVHDSFVAFRERARAWAAVSEVPFFQSRT
ncbi:MAG TPA: TRAP transporter substrate-binding protein DctP [Patescibacteria group bacterium]|nr:TRAP transporter substrate-binding protein DctP [Patescibacteria group bacterium]